MRPLLAFCALFVALAPTPAHAVNFELEYQVDVPAATGERPGPRLTFVDARPDDRGHGEIERVGHIRAGAGFPYPLKTKGTHFDAFFGRWVTECLAAAGWEASDGGGGPELRQTLEWLWIDGYMGYELVAKVRLEVWPPGAAAPTWTWTLDETAKETLQWSAKEFNKPFNQVLAGQTSALVDGFSSAEFARAMGGRASPEAAATTGSAGGCGKDTDCKGDRICKGGACVDPG